MNFLRIFTIPLLIATCCWSETYTDKNGLTHTMSTMVSHGRERGIDNKQTPDFKKLPIYTIVSGEKSEAKTIYGDVEIIGASILKMKNGGYNFEPTPWQTSISEVVYENEDFGYTTNSAKATFNFSDIKDRNGGSIDNEITGKKIVFARLFWAGRIVGRSQYQMTRDGYFNIIKDFNKIRFKTPKGIYDLVAPEENTYWDGSYSSHDRSFSFQYQASVDVTQLVKDSLGNTAASRTFSAGDIKTTVEKPILAVINVDGSFRNVYTPRYGGWALAIVYDFGPSSVQRIKPKGVNIYEGISVLTPINRSLGLERSATVKFDGFFTPLNGNIVSSFTALSFGAAKEISAEKIEIREDSTKPFKSVDDGGLNKAGEQFNSTISRFGKHLNSSKKYNASMDLDTYDITDKLGNGQSKAEVRLTAQIKGNSGDEATLGMVAFSTDAYIPEVCYVEELFVSSNNGTSFAEVSTDPGAKTVVSKGSILRSKLKVTNEGNEDAHFIEVSALIDEKSAKYKENTTYVNPYTTNSSFTLGALQTDNSPTGLQSILPLDKGIAFNLGQGATRSQGGTIKKNDNAYIQYDMTLNKEFKLVNYEVKFKNDLLKLKYGGVLNPCQGNKKYYLTIMDPGKYKVLNEKFAKKGDNENLFTQIAGKPFDVNIAFLSNSLTAGQTPTGPSEKQKVKLDVVTSCDATGVSVLINSPKPTVELDENNGIVKVQSLLINNAYSKLFFNISVFDKEKNAWESQCGYSDVFAVRPEKFVAQNNGSIVTTSEGSPLLLVGGAPYTNVGMAAVFGANNIADGYAQTLITDMSQSDDKDKKQIVRFTPILSTTCENSLPATVVSNLKNINAKAVFSQGKGVLNSNSSTNFSYPDIGLTKLYIKDASFTSVDSVEDDCIKHSDAATKNANGKVGCDIKGEMFLSFAPNSIAVSNLVVSNFSNDMTYLSNDRAMSSAATFDIQAHLGDSAGSVANLYTRSCYAQNVNFNMGIDQIIPGYTDNNGETTDSATTNAAVLARNLASARNEVIFFNNNAGANATKVTPSIDNDGKYRVLANAFADSDATAKVSIRFNFARATNLAKNPFTVSSDVFTFNNISSTASPTMASATGATYVKPAGTKITNTTFYYGQVYAPTYTGPATGFNADIYYGIYCNGCSTIKYPLIATNNALPQANRWFKNTAHNNIIQGTHGTFANAATTTVTATNAIVNGVESVRLSSTIAGTDIVSMNGSSWLIFDPSNAAATANRFIVNFTSNNSSWGGRALNEKGNDVGVGNVVGADGQGKLNDIVNKPSKRLEW